MIIRKFLKRIAFLTTLAYFVGFGCCCAAVATEQPTNRPEIVRIEESGHSFIVDPEVFKSPPEYVVLELGDINQDSMVTLATVMLLYAQAGVKMVILKINSEGGLIMAGRAFARLIEGLPQRVICVVDKKAASMALYVLQSCDWRAMVEDGLLIAHAPHSVFYEGTTANQWTLAELIRGLEQDSAEMAIHITRRTNMLPEMYEEMLRVSPGAAFGMRAQEALDLGFIDAVVKGDSVPPTTKSIVVAD